MEAKWVYWRESDWRGVARPTGWLTNQPTNQPVKPRHWILKVARPTGWLFLVRFPDPLQPGNLTRLFPTNRLEGSSWFFPTHQKIDQPTSQTKTLILGLGFQQKHHNLRLGKGNVRLKIHVVSTSLQSTLLNRTQEGTKATFALLKRLDILQTPLGNYTHSHTKTRKVHKTESVTRRKEDIIILVFQ